MVAVLCVGLGGFIGSVGRYLLGLVPVEGDFPLMTFAVNFAGAVLIGAVFEAATEGSGLPDNAVLFLKTGVCGGFTTFSAFSLETLALLERGKYATGALYACGSVLACLAGVVIGRLAVRGVRAALTGSAAGWGGAPLRPSISRPPSGSRYFARVALPGSMDMLWKRFSMYWLSKCSAKKCATAVSGGFPASRWYQQSSDSSVIAPSTIMSAAHTVVTA